MKRIFAIILALTLVAGLAACKRDSQGQTTNSTTESATGNSTQPTVESTEPSEAPSTEGTEPSTEGTEPSTEGTEPSTEGTEPSTEGTEPSTEGTEPSTEGTEPSTEGTEPSTEGTEPSTDSTEPPEVTAGVTVEEADGQRHYYLADGTKFCTEILDDAGKLLRREAYLDGALYRVWEYEYLENGKLDWVRFLFDVESDDWGWQYGGDTMVTQITDQGLKDIFNEDGELSATVTHSFDWCIREERYRDGLLAYSAEYDENLSVVAEMQYEQGVIFWSRSSSWDADTEHVDTAFYDERGQVDQKFHYEDWTEIWCSSFIYDENGNLFDEITEYHVDDERVISRKRHVYGADFVRTYDAYDGLDYWAGLDEQGRILWESFGGPYGEYSEYTNDTYYEYNDDGSYTTTSVGATGGLYYSHYDANDNLLDYFGGQDPGDEDDLMEMEEWDTYSYNEYGDMVSYQSYFYGELRTDCRYEYRYDENGHWVELTTYVDGEQMGHFFRTYDDQGRLLEEVDESGGCRNTYFYDEAGNLIEEWERVWDQTDIYLYEYDASGRLSQETHWDIMA